MDRSENIDQLAGALARAQGNYKTVKRSGKNPKFNSSYATLDDVIAAIRKPLSSEAVAYSQLVGESENGFTLTTIIMHESGQFISSTMSVSPESLVSRAGKQVRTDLQELGNALTYSKRYQLASMLGVNSEVDDDGNTGRTTGKPSASPPQSEQARVAQEEKARIEQLREAVKLALKAEGRAVGFLSDPPADPEWKAFYKALGPVYDALRKPGVPAGGFEKLQEQGIQLLRENAPQPEPEQEALDSEPDIFLDEPHPDEFSGIGIPPLD